VIPTKNSIKGTLYRVAQKVTVGTIDFFDIGNNLLDYPV